MESAKMILNLEDALVTINVGEAKEDILNEVSCQFLSYCKAHAGLYQ